MSGPRDRDGGTSQRSQTLIVQAPESIKRTRSKAVLTTATGTQTARVHVLAPSEIVTMGRGDDCTLRFDDASVSGSHARILMVGAEYVFADNRSTNGSYVNDTRIDGAVALKDGDRIRLGPHCMLRFNIVDDDEEAALKRMYEAALYDGLTRVYNRKHLEERLDVEVAFAIRHQTELSVILLDVDHFKNVNDTYGHLAGDAVLRTAAQVMSHGLRQEDLLARYGGEEFVVVARGTAVANAMLVADRLRNSIAATMIPFEEHLLHVTVSAGVASLRDCGPRIEKATPTSVPSLKTSLLGAADQRLYAAKQAGRNRIVGV
ncbi:diguanylate cyclase [Pendulispora rubella]|uniref:diguanylate cyclase n=1 Tax=Pendulispora rubella TaxID=2741070 RepID=A0ABZ2LFU6_9BACT